jgi:hypothetical protein
MYFVVNNVSFEVCTETSPLPEKRFDAVPKWHELRAFIVEYYSYATNGTPKAQRAGYS